MTAAKRHIYERGSAGTRSECVRHAPDLLVNAHQNRPLANLKRRLELLRYSARSMWALAGGRHAVDEPYDRHLAWLARGFFHPKSCRHDAPSREQSLRAILVQKWTRTATFGVSRAIEPHPQDAFVPRVLSGLGRTCGQHWNHADLSKTRARATATIKRAVKINSACRAAAV